ncbi:hypothetical protein PILCRDRAFT_9035 [Piloderma croceum F 1598]|uniref:Diphosphomevalonate decarboxylase-like N-terminal domain-containing protein n=1 Tax=Piloderma croceum (strain F 1598) TaxID=765440 RepID=A0A0C3B439_PILCF|nr:hypothetical protein PILCRDRAFT_9035 [Piloderma croceum F 1598]
MTLWQATVSSPVNITCIKYWGKRDTNLNLPVNSSLSLSLNQGQFCTTTTGQANALFNKDRLWLNGKEQNINPGGRLDKCIWVMRALRKKYEDECNQPDKVSAWSIHVASYNNFPTAAGLASSAAGFAALTYCLATVYRLPM